MRTDSVALLGEKPTKSSFKWRRMLSAMVLLAVVAALTSHYSSEAEVGGEWKVAGSDPLKISDSITYDNPDTGGKGLKLEEEIKKVLGTNGDEFVKKFNEIADDSSSDEAALFKKYKDLFSDSKYTDSQKLDEANPHPALWSGGKWEGPLPARARKMGFTTLEKVPLGGPLCFGFGFLSYGKYADGKHINAMFGAFSERFAEMMAGMSNKPKEVTVFLGQYKPASVVFTKEIPMVLSKGIKDLYFIGVDKDEEMSSAVGAAKVANIDTELAKFGDGSKKESAFASDSKILWTFKVTGATGGDDIIKKVGDIVKRDDMKSSNFAIVEAAAASADTRSDYEKKMNPEAKKKLE